jgi:hypothetical protein
MTLLWSENAEIKEKAKTELLNYFRKIMCSTYDIMEEELIHEKPAGSDVYKSRINIHSLENNSISGDERQLEADANVSLPQDVEMANCQDVNMCRVIPEIMSKQMLRNL